MIYLEFIKNENGIITYYYREKKEAEEYGIIEVEGEEIRFIKKLQDPIGWYVSHARRAIKEQIESGNYRSRTVAWY